MRFRGLDLLAFGPFTERRLDLSGDFHLIYGPNEAGKTSALRAIVDVLYGIPMHTPDAHHHDMRALRIGARLGGSGGRELSFVRRKGNKATLLDPDGRPLADDALDPFLVGVTRPLFTTMFGLDHGRFVSGAEGLLGPEGSLGAILFGASAGTRVLERVLTDLEQEASELWTPRGQKPRITLLLREHDDAVARARSATLAADEWRRRADDLASREREREKRAADRHDLSVRRTRLGRVQRTLPKIRAWEAARAAVAELAGGPPLPVDAPEARRTAVRARDEAARLRGDGEDEATRIEAALRQRRPAEAVLLARAAIESLAERRGAVVADAAQRPRLEADVAARTRAVEALERTLGGRPARADRALRDQITTLAREHERAAAEREAAVAERDRVTAEQAAIEPGADEVALDGDPARLSALARQAQRQVTLEVRRAELTRDAERARAEAQRLAAALVPPADPAFAPPIDETIARHAAVLDARARAAEATTERARQVSRARHEASRALDVLLAAGAPPTEADLVAARARRDDAIRAQLSPGAAADPRALWVAIEEADALADRLRRDADRVARRAALEAELAARVREEAEVAAEGEAHARASDVALGEWRGEWGALGAQVRSPPEMRAWCERHRAYGAAADRARDAQEAAAAIEAETAALLCELAAALDEASPEAAGEPDVEAARSKAAHDATPDTPPPTRAPAARRTAKRIGAPPPVSGPTSGAAALEVWASRAEEAARRIEEWRLGVRQRATARARLEVARVAAEAKLARLQTQEASWRDRWRDALAQIGQPPSAGTEAIVGVLESIEALHVHLDALATRDGERRAMDAQAEAFSGDVDRLIVQLSAAIPPAPPGSTAVQRLELLQGHLQKSLEDAAVVRQLEASLSRARDAAREAASRQVAAEAELSALMARAGVSDLESLEAAERRDEAVRRAHASLAQAEAELIATGGGLEVAALVSEAAGQIPEHVQAELASVSADHEALEAELAALDQAIGGERERQNGARGQGDAARAAEDAQAVAAELRRQVDRYALVKLGAAVLRRHADRYREAHAGPLLTRASAHVEALTLGALARLEAGLDGDRPVLLGVRPNGARVALSAMSDGTRDQVYLALRVATLEAYLDEPRSEPMPLIVDDILLHFDDTRAAAALGVLGELSARTQVLFFTHHHRLVELARAHIGGARLSEHTLA